MNGDEIALDTSVAIHVLNDAQGIRAWAEAYRSVYLPVTVVGELLFGAMNSTRKARNVEAVQTLISACQVLGTNTETARIYAEKRLVLRQRGTPIPENDLWIASVVIEHNLALATQDDHFAAVEGLRTVNPSS